VTTDSTDRHPSARRKPQEAVNARDALAAALTRAGIQLPAMDVRTLWNDEPEAPPIEATGTGAHTASPVDGAGPLRPPLYALVHLGVCSAPVAFDLAAVIERGVEARGAER
jgi:hypothetical protein